MLEDRKEVQRFTDQEGLLSNTIKALATDAQGHVWIGTNKGLNKWRPKKGGFIAFTERAGFTGIEVLPNAVAATGRGEVWFGTVNGATRVGSEAGSDDQVPPLVAIRGWKVNLEAQGAIQRLRQRGVLRAARFMPRYQPRPTGERVRGGDPVA